MKASEAIPEEDRLIWQDIAKNVRDGSFLCLMLKNRTGYRRDNEIQERFASEQCWRMYQQLRTWEPENNIKYAWWDVDDPERKRVADALARGELGPRAN